MPALYDYRIFISHAWKYGEDMIDWFPCGSFSVVFIL